METINHFNYLSFSTKTALLSFGIGTSIFTAHLLNPNEVMIYTIGLYYISFAILFNSIILLNIIYKIFKHAENRNQKIIQLLILLANIPIVFLYLYLIILEDNF